MKQYDQGWLLFKKKKKQQLVLKINSTKQDTGKVFGKSNYTEMEYSKGQLNEKKKRLDR